MPKSARYHIDRANSIVFTSKRLPLQPVSSERNHQVADKFRKVSCLNVYGRKRGRVGVKQCMHSFHSLDCLLSVFFDDYMSKLFPIFYLANFVCFYPSKYKAFPPNINYIIQVLIKRNFLACLQEETNSLRLFNVACSGLHIIKKFS